ncbi:MAG: extracellular solute-binding protein [Phycisphaerales bacterium]|nr:extracellular solute-binding protein [Planctomycetota bacterium]MBL6997576.1 extracellular solute-binding protein [Phycisphaerales bacterium]
MNKTAVIVIGVCLAILFGVPLFFRGDYVEIPTDAAKVIIISPHNEQIRHEFGAGFSKWHQEKFQKPAQVVWSVPGGTSEIRRMLISQYKHALETGKEPGGEADLVFGGGSYEHGVLKKTIESNFEGEEVSTTISVPAIIDQDILDEVYGVNVIGDISIYDPDGYWHGLALSGFGIVYNNEVLQTLDIEFPTSWEALCNPELLGRLALVNPAQSGSVTTAFEAILKNLGWKRGWQVLRRAAANARYFSASSLKPPVDVSQGDAAMGVCIDFYGRYQSQAVKSSGGGDRVGYIDPPSATMIDPDPISLLRGAPNEELAMRFIEYCLTREAQSLWQFKVDDESKDKLGPDTFELRRMPVRREMYTHFMDRMVDQVNPYETARPAPYPDRNMRAFIAPIFSAMAMDTHDELIEAWEAILSHPAYPETSTIVTAKDVDDEELSSMLELFDAMPAIPTNEDTNLSMDTLDNRKTLKYGWLRDQWESDGLWHPEDRGAYSLQQNAAKFFKHNYTTIVEVNE